MLVLCGVACPGGQPGRHRPLGHAGGLLASPVSLRLPWLPGDCGRCAASVRDARRGWRRGKSAVEPGLRWGTKASDPAPRPGGMPEMEVGIVITVLTVDSALQDTCAIFRERAGRGDITPAERDLLIDGAILLAMHVDDLAGEGRPDRAPGRAGAARPEPAGRHERHPVAAAA